MNEWYGTIMFALLSPRGELVSAGVTIETSEIVGERNQQHRYAFK